MMLLLDFFIIVGYRFFFVGWRVSYCFYNFFRRGLVGSIRLFRVIGMNAGFWVRFLMLRVELRVAFYENRIILVLNFVN